MQRQLTNAYTSSTIRSEDDNNNNVRDGDATHVHEVSQTPGKSQPVFDLEILQLISVQVLKVSVIGCVSISEMVSSSVGGRV